MKKILDYIKNLITILVAVFFIMILASILPALFIVFNIFILWAVASVDFLDIKVISSTAYYEFSVGMLIYAIPSFFIGIIIEVIILKIFNGEVSKSVAEKVSGFYLVLIYLYVLDGYIDHLYLSIKGTLALTLIYSILFEIVGSDELEYKMKEIGRNIRLRKKDRKNRKRSGEIK